MNGTQIITNGLSVSQFIGAAVLLSNHKTNNYDKTLTAATILLIIVSIRLLLSWFLSSTDTRHFFVCFLPVSGQYFLNLSLLVNLIIFILACVVLSELRKASSLDIQNQQAQMEKTKSKLNGLCWLILSMGIAEFVILLTALGMIGYELRQQKIKSNSRN